MKLENKNILLGVTGGIAAYKSPGICSLLRKNNANIKVVMTKAATEFVTPLTFETMSSNLVYTEMFTKNRHTAEVEHIELAKWADIIVIAPASANTIAKISNGIADNLLTSIMLASRSPVIIVPSMNTYMLNNEATRKNLEILRNRGYIILGTAHDLLACMDIGDGKMLEPSEIVDEIDTALYKKDLEGKKVVVTAGPTVEPLDPVRYITNRSSGKTGYEIAKEAKKRGADVTLISGPTSIKPPKVDKMIKIKTTEELKNVVLENFDNCDILIQPAAPADFKPLDYSEEKIKKSKDENLKIEFTKNPDVAKLVGEKKTHQFTVGFAAESQNEIENATKKLESKNLDMIVLNNIKSETTGFASDDNIVTIISKDGKVENLPIMKKSEIAEKLIDKIIERI